MGLALEVGILADLAENDSDGLEMHRQDFAVLNDFLALRGLPPHREPESCEVWSCSMYGYSGLHYLRRFAAHLDLERRLPLPGDIEAAHDSVLARYWTLGSSFDHLIRHGDAEGYYLPQDFPDVLFAGESEPRVTGEMVGSSPRLLAECRRLAATLDLPMNLEPESDEVGDAVERQGQGGAGWKRYGMESYVCLQLLRAAEHSIQTGAAVVFC